MLAVAAVLLAGCATSNSAPSHSVTITGHSRPGDGAGPETQTESLACGATANLTFSIRGGASGYVNVADGSGAPMVADDLGAYHDGNTDSLTGAAGNWTLQVTADYSGFYAITLSC